MAQLPDIPQGKELEDFIAAHFQAAGYFVEKNIEDNAGSGSPMLELDLVATKYTSKIADEWLVEVKGGKWGYTDVFKVLGWRTFLGIPRGVFVCTTVQADKASFERAQAELARRELLIVPVPDLSKMDSVMMDNGFPAPSDPLLVTAWRWSFWVERRLLGRLRAIQGQHTNREGPAKTLEYYRLVNNGVFFTDDVRQRLHRLYEAYMDHPKLTLGCAAEIEGKPYDPEEELSTRLLTEPGKVFAEMKEQTKAELIAGYRSEQMQEKFWTKTPISPPTRKCSMRDYCNTRAGISSRALAMMRPSRKTPPKSEKLSPRFAAVPLHRRFPRALLPEAPRPRAFSRQAKRQRDRLWAQQ